MQSRPGALSNTHNQSIPNSLRTDWHGQSVCMFFSEYVIPPDNSAVGFGFMQGLPDLWTHDDEASPYRQTVSAVALTSLAHRSSCFEYLVHEARHRYGTAMRLLMIALQNPEQWSKDSTLATVLCLGVYEVSILPSLAYKSLILQRY